MMDVQLADGLSSLENLLNNAIRLKILSQLQL